MNLNNLNKLEKTVIYSPKNGLPKRRISILNKLVSNIVSSETKTKLIQKNIQKLFTSLYIKEMSFIKSEHP